MKYIYLILGFLGLSVSIYLVSYHYLNIPLFCPNGGVLGCASVLDSAYSSLFGIPVSVLGVAFFAIEIALILFGDADARFIWNTIGFAFLFYLFYAEYSLGRICIYCTSVHVIVISLFVLSIYEVERKRKKP